MTIDAALAAIRDAQSRDPEQAEVVRGERILACVVRLEPAASPALRLAAQAQHIERWTLPRSAYPMDKVGYHTWRRAQYVRMGERAGALCVAAGIDAETAQRVIDLVAKRRLKEADGQILEDATCVVFLEHEIGEFAAAHPDYDEAKWMDILRKTWAKMGPRGRSAALQLQLSEPFAGLVAKALA